MKIDEDTQEELDRVSKALQLTDLPTGTSDVAGGNRTWATMARNSEARAAREGRRTMRHVVDALASTTLTAETDFEFCCCVYALGAAALAMAAQLTDKHPEWQTNEESTEEKSAP